MLTLTATKKAALLDQDDVQLTTQTCTAYPADPTIVGLEYSTGVVFLVGKKAGTTAVTVTRLSDGAVSTADVEVVPAAPFAWHLGPEVPA